MPVRRDTLPHGARRSPFSGLSREWKRVGHGAHVDASFWNIRFVDKTLADDFGAK
jgi:hypothetical protein